MEILVTYDISTASEQGRRRLRELAKVCEGYGQRVQKSVFECCLDKKDLRLLIHAITYVIDPHTDRVAIYRLREPYRSYVHTLGRGPDLDWREPIIL
jgi:CRISPR-associated protein Cas2